MDQEQQTKEYAQEVQEYARRHTDNQLPDSEKILARAQRVALIMDLDLLRNPKETLANIEQPEIFGKWLLSLTREVAEQTGADPAQLSDPQKRTKEQEAALEKALAQTIIQRRSAFQNSNYLEALYTIAGENAGYEDDLPFPELAVLYFFALHTDIDPLQKTTLTDANKEELKAVFAKMSAYLKSNPTDNSYRQIIEQLKQQNTVFDKTVVTIADGANTYRTKTKAGEVATIPRYIATLTSSVFQYAMTMVENSEAYLQPISNANHLIFDNGTLYFEDNTAFRNMREATAAELRDLKTKKGIEHIDLPLLRIFYSIILKEFEKTGYTEIPDVIRIYTPDLAETLGLQRNLNKKDINTLVGKTGSFHNIVGVMHESSNGRNRESIYPVLNFEGYDSKTNTISFSSPYMNTVIAAVYNYAVKTSKKGRRVLKKNGIPELKPAYSYLLKAEIAKERNKAAVEFVSIICTLIEQAGDNTPHIKVTTLIERNPAFADRLRITTQKTRLLKRTFEKTWELLNSKTLLKEKYKDIVLPDPTDPATIPTIGTLDSLVFEFPHKGKIKELTL